MDIKEIVLEAGHNTVPAYWLSDEKPIACSTSNFERLVSFAEALISAYKAELLKEAGGPVAYYDPDLDCGSAGISFDPLSDGIGLYTSDQVAAAIANAEQRVAEAIVDMLQQKHRNCFGAHSFYLAASVATANGEWRKFVKEM